MKNGDVYARSPPSIGAAATHLNPIIANKKWAAPLPPLRLRARRNVSEHKRTCNRLSNELTSGGGARAQWILL